MFNPGERVEGYTNFLWMALSAAAIATGASPVAFARVAGLASCLLTVVCLHRAARRLSGFAALAACGPLLFALSPAVAVWTSGGLETLLFTGLLTWATWMVADRAEEGALPLGSAVLAGALALTRPEGILVAAALLGATFFPGLAPAYTARRRLAWAAVVLALFLPYTAWRTFYYGDLLPNTFHAKVGLGGLQLGRGIRYLVDFVSDCGAWTPLALAGLWFGLRRRLMAVLAAVTLPYLAYVVLVGGDALPMYRFVVPVLGLLALAAVAALDAAAARLRGGARAHAGPLAAALLAGAALLDVRAAFAGRSFGFVEQDRREVGLWREIGDWFGRHAAPGESIALIPAGAIPYYSGLETIDMLGLTDRTIARAAVPAMGSGPAGHEKYDVGYVLSRRPTYVLLGVYEARPARPGPDATLQLYYPAEAALAQSPEFQERYHVLTGRVPSGYFTFFARNDKTFPQ